MSKDKQAYFLFALLHLLSSFLFAHSVRAQHFFSSDYIHEIRIDINTPNYWDSLHYDYQNYLETGKSNYRLANIEIDGINQDSVGFRMKGHYSNFGFVGIKKPFKIDFNEFIKDQRFNGVKKLNLHNFAGDPSFIRDHISYYILREQGIIAPETAFTKLYLNDTYWGLYLMVEQIDAAFLAQHFESSEGNLFKCVNDTEMKYDTDELKDDFDLKTNKDDKDWSQFFEFVRLINEPHQVDFYTKLQQQLDLAIYFKVLATDILLNNWDSYAVNGRNFYLYQNPIDNRFIWLPWDYNLAIWEKDLSLFPEIETGKYAPLIKAIMTNVHLKQAFLYAVCQMVSNLSIVDIEAEALRIHSMIKDEVYSDKAKFYSNLAFDDNLHLGVTVEMLRNNQMQPVYLPGILEKIKNRRQQLFHALSAYPDACIEPVTSEKIHTYPNPSAGEFTLKVDLLKNTNPFRLYLFDLSGKLVYETTVATNGTDAIRLAPNLSPGHYTLILQNNEYQLSTKIIIR